MKKLLTTFSRFNSRYVKMNFTKDELKTITLVQAAGIFSVVIGHFYFQPFDSVHPYVYHMPLFFFLGGLFMSNEGVIPSVKKIFKRHASYLIKSYIITGIVATYLVYEYGVEKRKPFSEDLISTITFTIKSNFGNNPLFVVGWFLFAYIFASLVCKIIVCTLKVTLFRNTPLIFISVAFLYIGMSYLPGIYTSRGMFFVNLSAQICTASAFMLIGFISKGFIFRIVRTDIMVAMLIIMVTVKHMGLQSGVNIAWSVYGSGALLCSVTSLCGIYIVFSLCHALSKLGGISAFIYYAGRNTKSIMTYHILAFYIIDIIFYKLGVYDITKIAPYSHYKTIESWPLYILSGMVVPLIFCWTYERVKTSMIVAVKYSLNNIGIKMDR